MRRVEHHGVGAAWTQREREWQTARMDRLQRFRAVMKNIGSTTAEGGVQDALLVTDADFMRGVDIAGRLELDPHARLLLVGGIGTGKTTQLEFVEKRLRESGMLPLRIDASLMELGLGLPIESSGALDAQSLVYAFSLAVLHRLSHSIAPDRVRERASVALRAEVESSKQHDASTAVVAFKLVADCDGVLLIDGFDRVFTQVFETLVRALGPLLDGYSIGCAMTGAADLPFAFASVAAQFSSVVFIDPVPVDRSAAARSFVASVIQRRLDALVVCAPEALARIIDLSSGVLRDALQLLKLSLHHAYGAGKDEISLRSVEVAAEEFARSKLFGLDLSVLAELHSLTGAGSLIPVGPVNLELFRRGVLVAHYDAEQRLSFKLHAAIAPMVPRIAA